MDAALRTGSIDVLLVEADPVDVRRTREALRDDKVAFTFSVVRDGVEAMAFLRREGPYSDAPRPDLILLDMDLPLKDGREVLREVRADAALSSIPVVVVTGWEARDIARAKALDADCHVTKPVGLDQLVRVVNSVKDFWFTIVKVQPDA